MVLFDVMTRKQFVVGLSPKKELQTCFRLVKPRYSGSCPMTRVKSKKVTSLFRRYPFLRNISTGSYTNFFSSNLLLLVDVGQCVLLAPKIRRKILVGVSPFRARSRVHFNETSFQNRHLPLFDRHHALLPPHIFQILKRSQKFTASLVLRRLQAPTA